MSACCSSAPPAVAPPVAGGGPVIPRRPRRGIQDPRFDEGFAEEGPVDPRRLRQLRRQREAEEERQRRLAARAQQFDEGDAGIGGPGINPLDARPGTITVWAHDLTAKPGRTYRYKLVLNVVNPLFGFDRLPPNQRDANRTKAALGPDPSAVTNLPWGEPITVEPMLEFFVIDGKAGSPATVEVFRRHDGRWHSERFKPAPGDPIGQRDVKGMIDMATNAVVVDIRTETDKETNSTTHTLLYVDEQGNMQVRDIGDDRKANRLKELRDVLKQQENDGALAAQPDNL